MCKRGGRECCLIFQCELNELRPFHALDDDLQLLIRQRNPKMQKERRLSVLSQGEDGEQP